MKHHKAADAMQNFLCFIISRFRRLSHLWPENEVIKQVCVNFPLLLPPSGARYVINYKEKQSTASVLALWSQQATSIDS